MAACAGFVTLAAFTWTLRQSWKRQSSSGLSGCHETGGDEERSCPIIKGAVKPQSETFGTPIEGGQSIKCKKCMPPHTWWARRSWDSCSNSNCDLLGVPRHLGERHLKSLNSPTCATRKGKYAHLRRKPRIWVGVTVRVKVRVRVRG